MKVHKIESYSIFNVKEIENLDNTESQFGIGAAYVQLNDQFDEKLIEPKVLFSEIKNIGSKFQTTVQIFGLQKILSEKHIQYAVHFANKAFSSGKNISNNRGMEYLLYLSTTRQISEALNLVGIEIKDSTEKLVFGYIISGNSEQDIHSSYEDLTKLLNSKDLQQEEWDLNKKERLKSVVKTFKISDFELENSFALINTLNKGKNDEKLGQNSGYEGAILRCLIERMALLSLDYK